MKVSMLMSQNCSSNAIGSLKAGCIIVLIAFTLLSISVNQALAQSFPPRGDDTTTSLGSFRIFVNSQFRHLMLGPPKYPGYDDVTHTLTSPLMFDDTTIIGRSEIHLDRDDTDLINGAFVGKAGTNIKDSDFSFVPVGFQGPENTREVHTEVYSLNMVDDCPGGLGIVVVRAGIKAPGRPISPGEVESRNEGNDFPAESFFNVFVEVDLPGFPPPPAPLIFPGGTIYNSTALVITNDSLSEFPPKVVYIHGNTNAVPVLFLIDDPSPGGHWNQDDVFGWMVLAGHGPEYVCDTTDVREFLEILYSQPELSLPFCQVTFDPLALDTVYGAPCGITIFTENDVPVSIQDFTFLSGGTTCNVARVDTPFSGFGVNHIMNTNNINLEFDFSGLGFPVGYVSFEFADLGGEVNISVNGELHVLADLTEAPNPIATGVDFSVVATAIPGGIRGKVELLGLVNTLRVGGQEFWLDNIIAMDGDLTTSVSDRNSQESSLPKVFALQQNYPNPFNPSTIIKYSVPETGSVKLSIYSIIGEQVAVLVNGIAQAGFYEVTFDAANLPSGIYFYRLQAGSFVETKKMVFMK